MSKNRLRTLPDEIGECTSLTDLHLSENNIVALPESIGMIFTKITVIKKVHKIFSISSRSFNAPKYSQTRL